MVELWPRVNRSASTARMASSMRSQGGCCQVRSRSFITPPPSQSGHHVAWASMISKTPPRMPWLRRRRPGGSSSRREYGSRLRTQEARQPQDRHEGCPCPTRSHTSSPQTSPAHSESVGQVVPAREGMPRMSCSLAQLLLHTQDTAQARRRTQSHGLGIARYPVALPHSIT